MANLLSRSARASRPAIDNVVEHAAGLRSLDDAARLLGTASSHVLALIERGAFPDAYQDDGYWRIPLRDIHRVQRARDNRSPANLAALVRTRRPYEKPHRPQSWLTPAERRELIADRLTTQRSVRVTSLSAELGVSQMTVRRDLTRLESDGRLVRTYGGAVAPDVQTVLLGPSAPRTARGSRDEV
jgi:hypothetical protein